MKKLFLALTALFMTVSANAATELHLFHSPHCPYCKNAISFFDKTLKKEYPKVKFVYHDVTTEAGSKAISETMSRLKIQSNGVPLTVIGDDHIVGYAPQMEQQYRDLLNKYEKGIPLPTPAAAPTEEQQIEAAPVEEVAKEGCSFKKKHFFPFGMIFDLLTLAGVIYLIVIVRKRK